MARLSVVLPIYNIEKCLHKCVDSILTQTFRDFELILVDDGSKDKSAEICDEYARKDNRVKVIHKENGGAGSARNVGIRNAGGEYITFVDSDDYLDRDHLQNFMDNCGRADMIMQGFRSLTKDGEIDEIIGVHQELYVTFPPQNTQEATFVDGFIWNKIYLTKIIREHQITFPENLAILEDRIFNMQYFRHIGSYLFLPTTTYSYVFRPGSLSRKKSYSFQALLSVGKALDNCEDLGEYVNEENMFFTARFFLRAFGGVFTSAGYTFSQRLSELANICRTIKSSNLLKKNGVKMILFFYKAMKYYLQKLIRKS